MLFVKSNPSVKNYTVFCGNTSTTVTDDTTSFSYVAGGTLLPTGSPAADFKKRIRLPFEMRDGDVYSLFVVPPNDTYHDHLERLPQITSGTNTYGMWWERVSGSATDIDVWFGQEGATPDTTWTTLNAAGWKWVFRATTLWGGSDVYPTRNGVTVTQAEANNYVAGDMVWCSETSTLYQYDAGSSATRDGTFVLNVLSGTGRLLAIAGQYARSEIIRGFAGNGIKFQENGGVQVGSVSDAGVWQFSALNVYAAAAAGGIYTAYGSTYAPASLNYRRSNTDPYLGFNTVQVASSDNQNYATSDSASRIWHDLGNDLFKIDVAAVGTAGNAITWVQAANCTTTGGWTLGPNSSAAVNLNVNGTIKVLQGNADNFGLEMRGTTAESTCRIKGGGASGDSNFMELDFFGSATQSTRSIAIQDSESTVAVFRGDGSVLFNAGSSSGGFELATTGVVTLGPSGSANQNLIVNGKMKTTGSGNILGTAGGSTSAPTRDNTNIVLYDFGATNWSGIGADGSGNTYFVTGLTAPKTVGVIYTDGAWTIGSATAGAQVHYVDGPNNATSTNRRVIHIKGGGYGAPGAYDTNSNGDKIVLMTNSTGSGVNTDFRIGTGTTSDMWFKATQTGAGSAGVFRWYNTISGSTTEVGTCNAGAWTLGPSSGLTTNHLIQASGSSSYACIVQNWTSTGTTAMGLKVLAGNTSNGNSYPIFYVGTYNDSAELLKVTGTTGLSARLINASTANAVYFNTSTQQITYASSSARFKDNIRNSVYGLNAVMALRSRMFEYKSDGRTDIGLIAEEVFEIIPELTGTGPDGLIEAVDYAKFGSVCIAAIQEQQAIIEGLKSRIEVLEAAS